jgi:hypothetical protein
MRREMGQALKVKETVLDLIQELLNDQKVFTEQELKATVELLARGMCDMVNVYTNTMEDHETVLKGTIVKVKIANNIVKGVSKTIVK